jgi:flagellin
MGLRIKTNISSLQAQRHLSDTTNELMDSSTKLASGERINRASDDAAGLAISENLRADVRSLNQAKRNANDGVSLIQTAEGGLMETGNMLIRLRELAIQSASDTISNTERGFVDQEFLALKSEIDRIANSTEFNGTLLLVGDNEIASELQATQNSFPMEVQVGENYYEGADSLDAENPINVIRVDLQRINAYTHGEGSLELGKGEDGIRVNTKQSSQTSIAQLDVALEQVNRYRAYLGAIQNRFLSSIKTLSIRTENISQARSRIRDTDFAAETANYTQQRILQQSGAAVLTHANTTPQIALSLISGG